MILKVYIQKHLFHLPRNQENLTEMIKEKFYKRKPLVKSGITKLYRITEIENKEIKYKNSVNIFLVNLYLLLLEQKGELTNKTNIPITLSDENIKNELSKELDQEVNEMSIEELEEKINQYMTENVSNEQSDTENSSEKEKIEVDFSMKWVKEMDKKIRE